MRGPGSTWSPSACSPGPRLEPAEGGYEFDWLDEVLDLLHRNGIRVALATPTASPPPWFTPAHPDGAAGDRRRGAAQPRQPGHATAPSAPAYRAAGAADRGRARASATASHPALALWHVHNEYGTGCYCDHAAAAFRRWLRDRYGDLDRLNEAWTDGVLEPGYGDWAHILPPAGRPSTCPTRPRRWTSAGSSRTSCWPASPSSATCCARSAPTCRSPRTSCSALGAGRPLALGGRGRPGRDRPLPRTRPAGRREQVAFAADLARGWAGGRRRGC